MEYKEKKEVVEIRAHNKFGGEEPYTVSLIFTDGTATYFDDQDFSYEDARIFIRGLKEGLRLSASGIFLKENF